MCIYIRDSNHWPLCELVPCKCWCQALQEDRDKNAQFSRSLLSSVILLLFIIFLAYCSVLVTVASLMLNDGVIMESLLWRILGDNDPLKFSLFFFSETSFQKLSIWFCIIPFPSLFKTFFFCQHVTHAFQFCHLWSFLLPSSQATCHTPYSTEIFSILCLVFLSWPIVVIILQVSVSKRMTLTNSLAVKFLDLLNPMRVRLLPIITVIPGPYHHGETKAKCPGLAKTTIPSSQLILRAQSSFSLLHPLRPSVLDWSLFHQPITSHYFSSFPNQASFHKASLQVLCQNAQLSWTTPCPTPCCWGRHVGVWVDATSGLCSPTATESWMSLINITSLDHLSLPLLYSS